MRFSFNNIMVLGLLAVVLGFPAVKAEPPATDAAKTLPGRIGSFRAQGPVIVPKQAPPDEERLSYAYRSYRAPSGKTYLVDISKTPSNAAAYTLLTSARGFNSEIKPGLIGTASIVALRRVLFCKGSYFGSVFPEDKNAPSEMDMVELAGSFAGQLDGGGDIPVLIKHLPESEKVGLQAFYAVTIARLKGIVPNQPILDVVNFEGGAEAAVAHYDAGTLAIIEFNTPQIATANDQNIAGKMNELRGAIPPFGTPGPSAYRRVGNYAVFVFDAPSPEAANQLIDQVKYQQVVQWLGENPFSYEKATREFTETTLGVFVSVVKASGLALVTCLAVGGIFGTLLFRVRRTQQRTREAYADSDAMIRLNLDELTPEADPARLLGHKT